MKIEAINKMAMDLVGDLQMIPVEQAYDRVKKYLNDAWERGASPDSFAYASIEEYEELVGFQANEAFRSGWRMARTMNSHIAALQESVKPKSE